MKKLLYTVLLAGLTVWTATSQPVVSKTSKSNTIHLTKADFISKVSPLEPGKEWKYLGDRPAVIDFYADWCAPCRKVAPILEELAATYDGKLYVYKIDTEAERELAAMFNVQSIPYLLFIPMGEQPQGLVGAAPKEYIEEIIQEFLFKEEASGDN